MDKEFYVVKFGEKYHNNLTVSGDTIVLTLVDDLVNARRYKDLDRKQLQRPVNLGGSVVEVNIQEYNRTFSLEREWEENEEISS